MDLIQQFRRDCILNAQKPAWISPDLYYDLLEVGMITFGKNDQPFFVGHELRVIPEMSVEYRFTDA